MVIKELSWRKCLTWFHPECFVARFGLENPLASLRRDQLYFGTVGHELSFLSSLRTRVQGLLSCALLGPVGGGGHTNSEASQVPHSWPVPSAGPAAQPSQLRPHPLADTFIATDSY